jgi:hypothetical protein
MTGQQYHATAAVERRVEVLAPLDFDQVLQLLRWPPPADRHFDQRNADVLVTGGLDALALGRGLLREATRQVDIDDAMAGAAGGQRNDSPKQAAERQFHAVGQQGHQPQQAEDAPHGPEPGGVVIARFEFYGALFAHRLLLNQPATDIEQIVILEYACGPAQ